MEHLSVKTIYSFLRSAKLQRDNHAVHLLPLAHDAPAAWAQRWSWLKHARLSPRARQTVFLRWHDRLYLGQTKVDL